MFAASARSLFASSLGKGAPKLLIALEGEEGTKGEFPLPFENKIANAKGLQYEMGLSLPYFEIHMYKQKLLQCSAGIYCIKNESLLSFFEEWGSFPSSATGVT